jgi:hypothetical protein
MSATKVVWEPLLPLVLLLPLVPETRLEVVCQYLDQI